MPPETGGSIEEFTVVRSVETFARINSGSSSADADKIDFDTTFLAQGLRLRLELRDELTTHCTDTAEEEVELFVIAHEEAVVEHTNRLAQLSLWDDERHTKFECSESNGVDPNTVST